MSGRALSAASGRKARRLGSGRASAAAARNPQAQPPTWNLKPGGRPSPGSSSKPSWLTRIPRIPMPRSPSYRFPKAPNPWVLRDLEHRVLVLARCTSCRRFCPGGRAPGCASLAIIRPAAAALSGQPAAQRRCKAFGQSPLKPTQPQRVATGPPLHQPGQPCTPLPSRPPRASAHPLPGRRRGARPNLVLTPPPPARRPARPAALARQPNPPPDP